MVDAEFVAILDSRNDLKEDGFDELVLAEVKLLLGDGREEIAVGAEVQDDEDPVGLFEDAVHGDDAWVSRRELVQGDFATLELALARVETFFGEALDGVPGRLLWGRIEVDCKVDHAVCTGTENGKELNTVAVDALASEAVSGVAVLGHFVWVEEARVRLSGREGTI